MKNIFLLILTVFTLSCKAQTNIVNLTETANNPSAWSMKDGNTYFKDINNLMQPYIGTWKWTQGNKEMTLTLIKQTKYHYTQSIINYYEDRIVGYYIYKENGLIIADTSGDNLNSNYDVNVHFVLDPSSEISSIAFYDYLKHKDYEVRLELLSPTQMKFHGREDTDITKYRRGTHTIYHGTTFPLEMTFIKQ